MKKCTSLAVLGVAVPMLIWTAIRPPTRADIAMANALAAYFRPRVRGPQPPLPRAELRITGHGGSVHPFTVELATTPVEQATGLMFRTAIPPGTGMLFDWGTPRDAPMWMKNCPVPEDMIFIGAAGTITHIAEDTVPESEAVISSGGSVRATLEVHGGLTAKLDIGVGDQVRGAIFK